MTSATRKRGDVIPMHNVKRICISRVTEDKFSFLWTLQDFAGNITKTKDSLSSPTFSGGGTFCHEWNAYLQNCEDDADRKGIFLCLKQCDSKYDLDTVSARFTLSTIDLNGRVKHTASTNPHAYEADDSGGYGFPSFLSIKEITNPSNNYLVNGGKDLQLYFEITVENPASHQVDDIQPFPSPIDVKIRSLEILSKEMRQFLPGSDSEALDRFDVEIVTKEGTKLPALSHILSVRSPVFKAMFKSRMKESLTKTIKISNFTEKIVRSFLEYIYTAQTEVIKSNPVDLMRIAHQYEVSGLVRDCENQLVINLTIENATEAFRLAHLHSLTWLKSKVVAFIKRNEKEVMKTKSFEKTEKANPAAVVELYKLIHSQ